MRTRTSTFAVAFLFGTALATAGAAQNQAPAAESANPASSQAQTSPATAATNASNRPVTEAPPQLVPQTRQGFWGKMNPFARKKYVRGQLQPIRDRVNELDDLTARNGNAISDLDRRSRAGIEDAQSRANQAQQTASTAEQKAQQAAGQADQLNQQVSTVSTNMQNADQYQVAQTAELRFRPGTAKLSPQAQQELDSFLQGLDQQKGYLVEVQAYAGGRGERAVENSHRLADSVVRYLVLDRHLPIYRIYTVGLGNERVPASTSNAGSRRERAMLARGGTVEVRILRNALAMNNAPPVPH